MALEVEKGTDHVCSWEEKEDDHERQGTVWTGTAHVVTAVIGSGVLALPWSVAQLGWVAGPIVLLSFACVTFYTSTLLADCYRYPHPSTGKRNRTYTGVVRSYLGATYVLLCGIAQYVNLWGTMVGYTITATASMIALQRSDCFHKNGREAKCEGSGTLLMVVYGLMELLLSQFPSLENVTWMSVVSALMSFVYSSIGLFLCVSRWASHGGEIRGNLSGAKAVSSTEKTWLVFQALGNIAFAYTYAEVLIEIQDTLKSPPPENKTMKKVTLYGIGMTSIFYISLGSVGYASFGNGAPGNLLTGFSFFEPFWLVDVANLCLVIHLVGAYQVFAQPIYANLEKRIAIKWPESKLLHTAYTVKLPFFCGRRKLMRLMVSKILLRSVLVIVTTLVAMLVPFFNAVLGLLGAMSFWPLTVFFPVVMHITQKNIAKGSCKWLMLHGLSAACLLVSLLATIGSVADIVNSLNYTAPFKVSY